MRQRLGLAAALLGDPRAARPRRARERPRPRGMRWLRDFLRTFASSGGTVLVSSHVLAEVEQTVDRVVIINHGRFVAEAALAEITATGDLAVRVRSPQAEQLAGAAGSRRDRGHAERRRTSLGLGGPPRGSARSPRRMASSSTSSSPRRVARGGFPRADAGRGRALPRRSRDAPVPVRGAQAPHDADDARARARTARARPLLRRSSS